MAPIDYAAEDFRDILVELLDGENAGVAIIWFNQPARLNAVTKLQTLEYIKAFALLERDDRVKCVVVSGKGRAFAAGASFHTAGAKAFDYSKVLQREHRDGTGRGVVAISHFKKPVIAAVGYKCKRVGSIVFADFSVSYLLYSNEHCYLRYSIDRLTALRSAPAQSSRSRWTFVSPTKTPKSASSLPAAASFPTPAPLSTSPN